MKNKKIAYVVSVIFVLILGILLFLPKFGTKEQERFTVTYIDVFDTATQIIGYADTEAEFKEHAEILKTELETYHKLYDIYTSYDGINNLRTINRNAGIEPVKVDQKIIDLLKYSIDLYQQTNGKTNIAMGSVLSIWHDYRTNGINDPANATLPPMELLQEAALHTDINNIIIDEEASTVYLADPEMSLDVGSIGKGYAVQKVAEYARELGFSNMIINVGGNAITIGPKADGENWALGIQNPDLNASNQVLTTVSFSDYCLVTSGDYQRYYTVNGIEYCHIIDPATLMPANHFKSVSIITNHSGKADALSTALFCMTYEEGVAIINAMEHTEAIWVFEDGTIKYSNNFKDFIKE